MTGAMPLALGYQQVRLDTRPGEIDAGRDHLAHFCEREGYALGEIFVESDINRQCSALAALIGVARAQSRPVTIVVACENDLGVMPRVRHATRARIIRETGCRVVVAR